MNPIRMKCKLIFNIFSILLIMGSFSCKNKKKNDPHWTSYTIANGLVCNKVYSIAIDTKGTKWFGTNAGVSEFDGARWIGTQYNQCNRC